MRILTKLMALAVSAACSMVLLIPVTGSSQATGGTLSVSGARSDRQNRVGRQDHCNQHRHEPVWSEGDRWSGQIYVNPSLPKDPVTGVPLALIPAPGEFGTLGRTAFTGPADKDVDASLLKETLVSERLKLQARFEVFSLLKRANPALPQRLLTDPSFGQSTRTQDVAGVFASEEAGQE